ncbi:MAG: hypothetical protein ACJ77K_04080 [Bacteroidia bacterium]
MKKVTSFFFFSLILAGFSCKKEKDPPVDLGYDYFPEKVGKFVIYDVDSFYYDDFTSSIDTFKFQIKEKIQSVYNDAQGRATLRLERYIKNYSASVPYNAMPWTIKDVWAANRLATTAEKVEENVRYVKLAFPVKKGQEWNGNAQNTNGGLTYSYLFFDQPRTIGGNAFDSVLQVNQQNSETLISKDFFIEKYARRTGMVYKQGIHVESQPNPDWANTTLFPFGTDSLIAFNAKPIMSRVTKGFQYTYIYNSSGTE